ncbi:hypothetical protein VPH35_072630 [Triticum aestivum]
MGSWKCRDAVPCVCKADWCSWVELADWCSCGSSILRSKMRSKPFAATCLCHVVLVASPNCTLDVLNYSFRSELLVQEINVSKCILVVDTSIFIIFVTSNSERREYILMLDLLLSGQQSMDVKSVGKSQMHDAV